LRCWKAGVGEGADGDTCAIIPILFRVEEGRTANRAEPESEPGTAIADAHVFGGLAEYRERSREAARAAKTLPVLRWQARQWQSPTPRGSPST
jgi:hypothetical protein